MGYKTIGGRLVIDEEKAATVKYAFEEYAKGTPKKDIIAELNARGLRNKNGKPYGCPLSRRRCNAKNISAYWIKRGYE